MACPVCFGDVSPAVRESMNLGILVLLSVTVAVLAAFGRFFVVLARRARHADVSHFDESRHTSRQ